MKIQRVEFVNVYPKQQATVSTYDLNRDDFSCKEIQSINYIPYNISFGFANAEKLKKLFECGVPCIYTGVEMIDPKKFQKQMKAHVYGKEASIALAALGRYRKTYSGNELKLFKLLNLKSLIHSDATLKDLISICEPLYEKILVKKQETILDKINKEIHNLPENYAEPFRFFMKKTYKKIHNEPVIEDFSTAEFQYKLKKISSDEDKTVNIKAAKVMEKLKIEADKLELKTTSENVENQKHIIDFLEKIRKRSCLKNNEQLKTLIKNSKDRLLGKPVPLPFTRKSFIYDTAKLLYGLPDEALKAKIINLAYMLPSSQSSFSAYIVKVSKESSDKIAYRIAWPYFASIEHLLPRSCGGNDVMENYAGACTRANSARESIDFTEQIKLVPATAKYCQKYVDRLIELAKLGVFKKINLDTKYINDFKNTIEILSKGSIILDTSKLHT